jgi:hypothetical protein
MDERLFDALARSFATPRPRRSALRFLTGGALAGILGGRRLADVKAAKGRCKRIGKPCKRSRQCCSGICSGRKGRKKCREHDVGTCPAGSNSCELGVRIACNGDESCGCFGTRGGGRFCGNGELFACVACTRDAECTARGFPPGSACIALSGPCLGACAGEGTVTACVPPCDAPNPS